MEETNVTQADSRANWPMLTKFNPAATNKTSQKGDWGGGEVGRGEGGGPFCDVLLVAAGLTLVNIGQLALLSAKAGEVQVPLRRPQPMSKKLVVGSENSMFLKNHQNHNLRVQIH